MINYTINLAFCKMADVRDSPEATTLFFRRLEKSQLIHFTNFTRICLQKIHMEKYTSFHTKLPVCLDTIRPFSGSSSTISVIQFPVSLLCQSVSRKNTYPGFSGFAEGLSKMRASCSRNTRYRCQQCYLMYSALQSRQPSTSKMLIQISPQSILNAT